jgi:small-conductance mechanosensitive channel
VKVINCQLPSIVYKASPHVVNFFKKITHKVNRNVTNLTCLPSIKTLTYKMLSRKLSMPTQNDWQTALSSSYEQLSNYLVMNVPKLISALFLILLGWVIAWPCSKLTLSTVKIISRKWQKAVREITNIGVSEIKASHASVISKTVFWVVMLFFMTAASSRLGHDFFSIWLNTLLGYVSQLLATVFIVMASYLLGNILGGMAQSASKAAKFSQSASIGNIAKYSIFFVALVVGIEQLGINIQFITTFIIVVIGVLLFGVALAFGMGSNAFVANIIAARQADSHFRLNEHLKVVGVEGTLINITSTMLLIETEEGRVLIPARVCMENKKGKGVDIERTATTTPVKSVI